MSLRRRILIISVTTLACASLALGQDSQSIADIARQARQKQQAQAQTNPAPDASGSSSQPADPNVKTPKATHVYTNDEIPEHTGPDLP